LNKGLHFISGLPRSGSTLLAALLRQNPALHANITSPVSSMVGTMLAEMSAGNEGAVFFDVAQRAAVLRGLFDNYYHAIHPTRTVFDTSRGWTTRLDLLARLFPDARVICCVRPIPWIIDSVERLLRRNPFELSKIFGFEQGGTVYSRADGLMSPAGMIGFALNALKQAMHGDQAGRILLLPYDTLVSDPLAAMNAVYDFTGLPFYRHNFDAVRFDASEFDARLGTPGLHDVRPQVRAVERKTILPPDLWERFERSSVWRMPEFNTTAVRIACEPSKSATGSSDRSDTYQTSI
jgi:sulfotransferase